MLPPSHTSLIMWDLLFYSLVENIVWPHYSPRGRFVPIKLMLCMLAISILPVSKIILFDFRIVLTMSYFVFFISLYIFIAISSNILRLVCRDQSFCYYSSVCFYAIQCSLSLSPPVLSPKFLSVPISPIKNTPLHCQTQLLPSTTCFQTHKS